MEIIYRQEQDRWIKGDKYVRPVIRRIIRGQRVQLSGMERVVRNFLKGLTLKKVNYRFNAPSYLIKKSAPVISFGLGRLGVAGLHPDNPIIAAIGFPYPDEFPDLCVKYNVHKFLQHSRWALDYVASANKYNNNIFEIWPAGIDVNEWKNSDLIRDKEFDVLIYNKILWDKPKRHYDLVLPIKKFLAEKKLTFEEIFYGQYTVASYKNLLSRCKVMIFLCEHESQGLAYQECLSCNVPVIAWDQGYYLDPDRFKYNRPVVVATSIPYFDDRCGIKFRSFAEFQNYFDLFYDLAREGKYFPRDYILENLTIEKSTERMLKIYSEFC